MNAAYGGWWTKGRGKKNRQKVRTYSKPRYITTFIIDDETMINIQIIGELLQSTTKSHTTNQSWILFYKIKTLKTSGENLLRLRIPSKNSESSSANSILKLHWLIQSVYSWELHQNSTKNFHKKKKKKKTAWTSGNSIALHDWAR